MAVLHKPSPEQLLKRVESDEKAQGRGRLKIFLGYASGVGKSFRMLDEARRRQDRGQDLVVAAVQPNSSPEAQAALSSFEAIPMLSNGGQQQLNMPAILERRPKICLIDGVAYDNPPGSPNPKRWQDIEQLLDAGISVITSVNLQHVAEKAPEIEAITGRHVQETIPLSFVQMADEIVVVDAPPALCLRESSKAKRTPLTQHQLAELREIALLLVADVVDKQLERYLDRHGIQQLWGTQERILVCLTPSADAGRMLESAVRNRDRFHGELIAIDLNRSHWTEEQKHKMQEHLDLARQQRAEIAVLAPGNHQMEQLMQFARQRGITQIYIGRKRRESWRERAFGSDLDNLIRAAEGMDVRVFPHS